MVHQNWYRISFTCKTIHIGTQHSEYSKKNFSLLSTYQLSIYVCLDKVDRERKMKINKFHSADDLIRNTRQSALLSETEEERILYPI
jgi:hypothetical protein